MLAVSPSLAIEVVPYLLRDLEGHVIYAHPDFDLVAVRAWVEALQQSRVFISTSKDVIKILFDVEYRPDEQQNLYLMFEGLLTDEFGVITTVHSWDKRGPRLEVSATEIGKRMAELGDQPNTSCLQHNAQRLLTEADARAEEFPPELQAEYREKALRSAEWINKRVLGESKNTTIDVELKMLDSFIEASSSQQPTPAPTNLKDLLSMAPDMLSDSQLFALLSEFVTDPPLYNRTDYPFIVDGFICQESDATIRNGCKMITVYTRRLGPIVVQDMACRNANPYSRFICIGPDAYRAFEFDSAHPSFKSTKFVSALQVECKGYALMSKGNREDSESKWFAWSDHTGLMRCVPSCARMLKKKYSSWQPTLQMVMFDASSRDSGRTWEVKNISYLDYEQATKNDYWPQHAYFVPDLTLQDGQQAENREFYFTSGILDDPVRAKSEHVELSGIRKEPYGAVVVPEWSSGMMGLVRSFKAIMVAPLRTWTTNRAFHVVANRLRQYKKTDMWTCPPLLNEAIGDYSASTPFIQKQAQSRDTTFIGEDKLDKRSSSVSSHFGSVSSKGKLEERTQQHCDWDDVVAAKKATISEEQTTSRLSAQITPAKQTQMEQNLSAKPVSRFAQQQLAQKPNLVRSSFTPPQIEGKQEAVANISSKAQDKVSRFKKAPPTEQELFAEPSARSFGGRSVADSTALVKATGEGFGKSTNATDEFVKPQTPNETHSVMFTSTGFGKSVNSNSLDAVPPGGRTSFNSSTTTTNNDAAFTDAQKTTIQSSQSKPSNTVTDTKPTVGASRFTTFKKFNTSTTITNSPKKEHTTQSLSKASTTTADTETKSPVGYRRFSLLKFINANTSTNSQGTKPRCSPLDLQSRTPLGEKKQLDSHKTSAAQLDDIKILPSFQNTSPQVQRHDEEQTTMRGDKSCASKERLIDPSSW